MDDDLMSLRGSGSTNNNDDLFGSFSDPDDLGFDAPLPASRPANADDFDFSDPFDLPAFDQPTIMAPAPIAPAPASAASNISSPASGRAKARPKARTKKKSAVGFLGMTAPQRMVLAIFLFLIVSEYGFFILLIIGAINF